jgi:hypothetical protein
VSGANRSGASRSGASESRAGESGAGERGAGESGAGESGAGGDVIERVEGRGGELVLRRRGSDLEVISNGTFLISTANEHSSRALIAAALPYLPARPLEVLIGGLGMGFALDEALRAGNVRRVTVAELEPVIVDWFERYGGERAQAAGAAAGERSRIVVTDVFDLMRERPGAFDLIALDTDNGPEWLVREPTAWRCSGRRASTAGLPRCSNACLCASSRRPPTTSSTVAGSGIRCTCASRTRDGAADAVCTPSDEGRLRRVTRSRCRWRPAPRRGRSVELGDAWD